MRGRKVCWLLHVQQLEIKAYHLRFTNQVSSVLYNAHFCYMSLGHMWFEIGRDGARIPRKSLIHVGY